MDQKEGQKQSLGEGLKSDVAGVSGTGVEKNNIGVSPIVVQNINNGVSPAAAQNNNNRVSPIFLRNNNNGASLPARHNNNGYVAECIDLTQDEMDEDDSIQNISMVSVKSVEVSDNDSDIVILEDEEEESESSYESVHYTSELIINWETDKELYPLYTNNRDFNRFAKPYLDLLAKYSKGCIQANSRISDRGPTIDEFWNYVIAKCIPRRGWIGHLKYVNAERRGWPLQHVAKAEVVIEHVTVPGQLSLSASAEMRVRAAYDPNFNEIDGSRIPIWQIDPLCTTQSFDHEGPSLEEAKEILGYVRSFYETLYVPPEEHNMEDLQEFVTYGLYSRLQLMFCMENPVEMLAAKDRGRLIAAFKQYHFIRNMMIQIEISTQSFSMQDVIYQASIKTIGPAVHWDFTEIEKRNANKYVILLMQMDRLKVELNFLKSSTLRHFIDDLVPEVTDDTFSNYSHVLVQKEATLTDMPTIYDQLREYVPDPSSCKIRFCTELEDALKHCAKGAFLFVASGNYKISGIHNLSCGGSLIGIRTAGNDVTVTPTDDIGDVWIHYRGTKESQLLIKNINLVIESDVAETSLSTCLQVSSGNLIVENVDFRNLIGNCSGKVLALAKQSEGTTVSSKNCNFTFEKTVDESDYSCDEYLSEESEETSEEDMISSEENEDTLEDVTRAVEKNEGGEEDEEMTEKEDGTTDNVVETVANNEEITENDEEMTEKEDGATENEADAVAKNEMITEKYEEMNGKEDAATDNEATEKSDTASDIYGEITDTEF